MGLALDYWQRRQQPGGMSIADAKAILSSTNDAATQYFRRTTQTNLHARFYPLVQKATDSVGVAASYKQMMGKFTATGDSPSEV